MQRIPSRTARGRTFSWTGVALVSLLGACSAARGPEIDPRFLAVHNTLSAMGLAQVGPVQQGSLVEGREARLTMDLAAQCTTLVAMGGEGVRDLDATLLDPRGNPVAKDATHESQAVVRACVEAPGTYTLVVKMAAGSGEFLTAMWGGGSAGGGGAGVTTAVAQGGGTCESPIVIGAGTYSGNTSHGEAQNEGACAQSRSKELVYKIEVPSQKRMIVEVEATFDSVLYLRKEECDSQDAEVQGGCNDDADGNNAKNSKVDVIVDPGTYYVFVDGYDNGTGSFHMNVAMNDVPSLADVCSRARPLAIGTTVQGGTTSTYDLSHASCGDEAKGKDTPYRFDLAQKSRVRFIDHSDDFGPVTYVRRACADDQTEVSCSDSAGADNEAAVVSVLDPGAYWVFADSRDQGSDGRYQLSAETAPEQGSGIQGDGCADAEVLAPATQQVSGDTFFARDDVAGRCGAAGGADAVYRIDLPRKSRLRADLGQQDGSHMFVLQKTCGDRTTELSCGPNVDKVLPAGTYFLAVDGSAVDDFGRYTFDLTVKDVGAQEAACKSPTQLSDGQSVQGTTVGAGHRFTTGCGGPESAQTSGDKLYKIVTTGRTHVRLALTSNTFDGVLALRRACVDPERSTSPAYSEVACNNDSIDSHHSQVDTWVEAGTYYVVVSGHMTGNEGAYSLEYHVVK